MILLIHFELKNYTYPTYTVKIINIDRYNNNNLYLIDDVYRVDGTNNDISTCYINTNLYKRGQKYDHIHTITHQIVRSKEYQSYLMSIKIKRILGKAEIHTGGTILS